MDDVVQPRECFACGLRQTSTSYTHTDGLKQRKIDSNTSCWFDRQLLEGLYVNK